jgi:hypothetical protein
MKRRNETREQKIKRLMDRGLSEAMAVHLTDRFKPTSLPAGVRYTKPIRFSLPESLAELLENLPKEERDQVIQEALESLRSD